MIRKTAAFFSLLLLYTVIQAQDTTRRATPTVPVVRKPTVLAALLRGPYLQVATDTSIVIRWRTNALTRSVVHYGNAETSLLATADNPELTFEHSVLLKGLQPRTKYYYSIGGGYGDTLQHGPDNWFVTLPPRGATGPYRIGVFGDCGNKSPNQLKVRDQVLQYMGNDRRMDAWILLGDNAYVGGTDPEYQEKFFDIYKDNLLKNYPLFPSPGNHEYNDLYEFKATAQATHDIAYFRNFSMPIHGEGGGVPSHNQAYYSFDIGNIHFLSLDSYGKEDNTTRLYDTLGAQVQWIKKDLEAFKNTKRGWVVAFFHHPPYTMGSHDSDRETELVKIRENFVPILERYGVDLVLCGHSHVYERTRLMQGHFGMEETFNAQTHNLSSSSGLYDGSSNACPYIKDPQTNKGTVYVVTGSAGAQGGAKANYPHNAMYYSHNATGGASMLEVEDNKLTLKFLAADGEIKDHFVMMKDVNKRSVVNAKKGQPVVLQASYVGNYTWNKSKSTLKNITVTPPVGRTVYEVYDTNNCLKDIFEVNVRR